MKTAMAELALRRNASQHSFFRFCKAVHAALQELRQYKTADGADAVIAWVACDPESWSSIDEPFGTLSLRSDSLAQESDFVCRVLVGSASGLWDEFPFYGFDFEDDAAGARLKFGMIFARLAMRAQPKPPQPWIEVAIDVLGGDDFLRPSPYSS